MISADGSVEVHVQGVAGTRCVADTDELVRLLGGSVEHQELTEEAYQQDAAEEQDRLWQERWPRRHGGCGVRRVAHPDPPVSAMERVRCPHGVAPFLGGLAGAGGIRRRGTPTSGSSHTLRTRSASLPGRWPWLRPR
ncbi:DUF2997 domain-containing protein [Streptomyces liliifuscus]|uniref:DUF2997 domain-containing protein n=1 Tax=Streptomyces liliifuscus TaxID=2797636 RepID=A0A7T7KUD1_9ACTN|nr:DUF2997 domain-containing protein [Streptomyces liliifuscus]